MQFEAQYNYIDLSYKFDTSRIKESNIPIEVLYNSQVERIKAEDHSQVGQIRPLVFTYIKGSDNSAITGVKIQVLGEEKQMMEDMKSNKEQSSSQLNSFLTGPGMDWTKRSLSKGSIPDSPRKSISQSTKFSVKFGSKDRKTLPIGEAQDLMKSFQASQDDQKTKLKSNFNRKSLNNTQEKISSLSISDQIKIASDQKASLQKARLGKGITRRIKYTNEDLLFKLKIPVKKRETLTFINSDALNASAIAKNIPLVTPRGNFGVQSALNSPIRSSLLSPLGETLPRMAKQVYGKWFLNPTQVKSIWSSRLSNQRSDSKSKTLELSGVRSKIEEIKQDLATIKFNKHML